MHRTILLIGFLSIPMLWAGDTALDRGTLQGVKSLNIVIDQLDPQLERVGLTKEVLRARIEDRLRIAGVSVDSNAIEFVGLRVDAMLPRKGANSLCFSLGFYQPVLLSRDQKIHAAPETWDVRTMLVVPAKPMVQSALTTVEQLADQFVAAYRSVNKQ